MKEGRHSFFLMNEFSDTTVKSFVLHVFCFRVIPFTTISSLFQSKLLVTQQASLLGSFGVQHHCCVILT